MEYTNPYTSSDIPSPASTVGMNQTATSSTMTYPAKPRTNWLLTIIFFLVGLLAGGAAGYFASDYLLFRPKLETLESEKAQLEARVAALENEITLLKQGGTTGSTIPTTGTVTPGTGTAPTLSGITADPQTATWSTYTNPDFHISFKYPADMTVREFQNSGDLAELEDDDAIFAAGIYKTGDPVAAGMVFVYKTEANEGPSHRTLTLFNFPAKLPTTIVTKAAGAGQLNDVSEKQVILNSTSAFELGAIEGSGSTPTPGGDTYKGYLIENQFNQNYLVTGCSSDTGSQAALVGCLMQTTLTITR